jgi:GDPmannose 4,6-dehydratase
LKKGYEVHGFVRRVALETQTHRLWRIRHLIKKIHLHSVSMESYASIFKVIHKIQPNEIYHLAAQSYVSYSFEDEFSTLSTNINGTHYVLSAIKETGTKSKFYFAGSSEMFGKVSAAPQNEKTKFHPRSPYGISKVAGFELTRNYREAYNLHASSGILFNHESERRGFEFVTRKISIGVAKIKLGIEKFIELGNLDAQRDWGYAPEYVEAMWMMLQQKEPDDYVVGNGKTHSVKEFVKHAFESLDLDYQKYVKINKNLFRPSEVDLLQSDCAKIKNKIGWKPKTSFEDLVSKMVIFDYNRLKNK